MDKTNIQKNIIKEEYEKLEKKDNCITAEEVRQLLKEAQHILDYIKNPRQLESSPPSDVYCNVMICRELDMTIAKIVHEIKCI